jgi:hypothetical protein
MLVAAGWTLDDGSGLKRSALGVGWSGCELVINVTFDSVERCNK